MELQTLRDALAQLQAGITLQSVRAYQGLDWHNMPSLNAGLSNALLELRSSAANQLLAETIRDTRTDCKGWIESGGWPMNPLGRVLEPMIEIARAFPLQSELRELLNLENQAGFALSMERLIEKGHARQVGGEVASRCELVNQFINIRNSLVTQAAKVPCVNAEVAALLQSVEGWLLSTKVRNVLTIANYELFQTMLRFETGATLVELYNANPNAWDSDMPDNNGFKTKLNRILKTVKKYGYEFKPSTAKDGSFSWIARP